MSDPLLGAVLGIILGAGLLVFSRNSFKLMTPESGPAGYAMAAGLLLARMGLVVLALLGYRAVARPGALAFGLAAAVSFLVAYGVELVRYSGLGKQARRRLSGSS